MSCHHCPQFARQVEELVLVRCSLLPDEIFQFVCEDVQAWTQTIDAGCEGGPAPSSDHSVPSCPAQFIVKPRDDAPVWVEVALSEQYPAVPTAFQVMFRGHAVSRAEQAQWHDLIAERRNQIADADFPVFELISAHLLPLLHTSLSVDSHPSPAAPSSIAPLKSPGYAHALLTSHHLKSPQKRRSLQAWSSELRLAGFAKVGHPGIIYCSGAAEDVGEFVRRVKDMQWLALRVRFEEPLLNPTSLEYASWVELQKVGEVVEEMRRLGRENYVLDLGIGSGGR